MSWRVLAGLLLAALAPALELARGDLALSVAVPGDGFYRAARFDAGGMVTAATWRGHRLFGILKQPRDPAAHDGVAGAADEYDPEHPPGYDLAAPGGLFLKIGVGALVRTDATPYHFSKPYAVAAPATATVEVAPGTITCRQSAAAGDHACRSVRTIRIHDDGAGFDLVRELTATGSAALRVEQYDHCMLNVDGEEVGPGYRLRFPAAAQVRHRLLAADADGTVRFTGAIPANASVWTVVGGLAPGPAGAGLDIVHPGRGIAIRLSGDTPPSKVVLYAERTALCPEIFTAFTLPPGATRRWVQTFRFAALAGDGGSP